METRVLKAVEQTLDALGEVSAAQWRRTNAEYERVSVELRKTQDRLREAEAERDKYRALILALPKMEGLLVCDYTIHWRKDGDTGQCTDPGPAIAALLAARQEMP